MLFKSILSVLALVSYSIADVSISKPISGASFEVDGDSVSIPITWVESSTVPKLENIKTYTFLLCTGPNNDIDCISSTKKTVQSSDITDYTYDFSVDASAGATGKYYVQIYTTVTGGGYSIHYSYRFTLESMTGSKEPSGTDSSPPSSEVNVETTETTAIAASDLSKSFSVFYTSQTGATRYAPMQTQPGTTVTATTWTRKFPTSSVSYYSTLQQSLDQISTVTPGWSYTVSSAHNWASPAPNPSENGGWYNPSSRVASASLSALSKTSSAPASSSTS